MLDIKYIREHAELVKQNCANRGVKVDVDRLLALDHERRTIIAQTEELRASRNKGSKGKPSEEEIAVMRKLGDDIAEGDRQLEALDGEYAMLLRAIPNLTHPDAPVGGEEDFKVVEENGKKPEFDFEAKDHEELMTALDVIDFERGAKTTGAKFYFAKNQLVRLNQALLQYGMDILAKHGFTIMETPDLVKNEILDGVGFSPRGAESNTYALEETDLSLIATAEISLGGYHANEIVDLSNGPIKYAGISHCFRKEAGTYGKASKGLYRVHQFTKLEMFVYCKPEESEATHKELLQIEKEIADGLQIPYRIIDTASGDLGGPAYRKYDIEAWMVMNDGYGEITSTSNCTDYQARRLNIRYRTEAGETAYAHTLNGTAVVLSRFPIAIFENYQEEDGSIKIPEVLQPYMGGLKIISKK
jgi:seryl-tRNA synthetase